MRSQKGVTLIDASIILIVLLFLAAFLAPSIYNYIKDAKAMKTKTDVETIGAVTARLMFDLGFPCLKKDGKLTCQEPNRADIVYGEGPDVTENQVMAPDFIYYKIDIDLFRHLCGGNINQMRFGYDDSFVDGHYYFRECVKRYPQICSNRKINWFNDDEKHGSPMEGQLNTNLPRYLTPGQKLFQMIGPQSAQGWRGSYLGFPVGTDAWGHRYLVNSLFTLIPEDVDIYGVCYSNIRFDNASHRYNFDWSYDTFVISAGPNGIYETPFALRGAQAKGDDIIYVIQGDPR